MTGSTLITIPKREARIDAAIQPATTAKIGPRHAGTAGQPLPIEELVTQGSAAQVISIERLYERTESSRELLAALDLLLEAKSRLQESRMMLKSGDALGADRSVTRFRALLDDLFVCRGIGDGYGNVINAITISLVNLHGRPLDIGQLGTLWRIIADLRERPFLSLEASFELIDQLEDSGFLVDPVTLPELIPID